MIWISLWKDNLMSLALEFPDAIARLLLHIFFFTESRRYYSIDYMMYRMVFGFTTMATCRKGLAAGLHGR
jgi:hypothetical protein